MDDIGLKNTVPGKATLDPEVIASWQAALAAYRARWTWLYVVAGVSLAAVVLLSMVVAGWIIGLLVPVVILLYVVRGIAEGPNGLKCPHCGKLPFRPFERGKDVFSVEWCDHCYYWLRKPW